ncbi:unnamed protein product [Clonostachys byssicola]|uniref:inorganic diphosphatase n=1 Tax=Clonostachys byssicola TaxID=160290 RepID=A0A9N9UI02_9HYPO|nr:unnamed protein product [Clonostachys byssicola]
MIYATTLLRLLAVAPAAALAGLVVRNDTDFDYSAVSLREVGARNTLDWRVWLEKDGNPISFWHDIPLYPNSEDKSIINFYTEIPRWTDGKIETKRDEPLSMVDYRLLLRENISLTERKDPIFHDDKKKQPRFVYSVWPHKTYPFNYGSIPQTWESPNHKHNLTGYVGDNDPIDIFEISSLPPAAVGEIRQVKVLGGLPMIDEETTDWKVIAIDVNDPLAKHVNTVNDLDKYRPGLRQQFHEWFIYYKVIKGDGINTIVGGEYKDAATMQDVIAESHGFWQDLVKGKGEHEKNEIAINQTSNARYCKSYIKSSEATEAFNIPAKSNILPAAARPSEYDNWYYLDSDYNQIIV